MTHITLTKNINIEYVNEINFDYYIGRSLEKEIEELVKYLWRQDNENSRNS